MNSLQNSYNNQPFVEWDFIEMAGSNPYWNCCSGGWGEWNVPSNTIGTGQAEGRPQDVPGFDPTQYHAYGFRVTQDTNGNFAACYYLDDVQISPALTGQANRPGCLSQTYVNGASDTSINQRNQLLLWSGPEHRPGDGGDCSGGNSGVSTCTPPAGMYVYFKRITVWTCANWQTTGCTGTVDSNTP